MIVRMQYFRAFAVISFFTFCLSGQVTPPKVDFTRVIQPIFQASCYNCHGPKTQMADIRLDSKAVAMRTIRSGQPTESALYRRVAGIGEEARMPMGAKPLEPSQIESIRRWIEEGAAWPEETTTNKTEDRKHWAFIAPRRPSLPRTANQKWTKNAVDRFVLARL